MTAIPHFHTMCGIAGALDGNVTRAGPIAAQLRALRHRGPDATGVHVGCGGVIGQTRLAVIDLETGDPPITNEDGRVGVALNGEIYNYRALRDDLRRRGHRLRTEGDTEVIAHLAEDHEPVALARRLHGMFAFAVWDDVRRRLILGRDRLGKKPLYYWSGNGRFVFGSEIKAVLAHPDVPRELNVGVLPAYLAFGSAPSPRTFFADVLSVPPGHVLSVTPGHDPVVERYWAPEVPRVGGVRRYDLSLDEAAAEIRGRLRSAVDARLVADVPIGAFLSGGIDSSAIVGLMAETSARPVKTFTIGFDDNDGFDERPYARLVAQRHGTDHTEFVVKPAAAEHIEALVWHHDQPFGDSSALPTYLLAELTRKHVTVALSGDGGDELFAGYERFAAGVALQRFDRLPSMLRSPIRRFADAVPADAFGGRAARASRVLRQSGLGLPNSYLDWVNYVPEAWRQRLQPDEASRATAESRAAWDRSDGAGTLDRLLDLNLRTYLLDDLLPKIDRMTMAHGLEVRSPFLDTDLVAFALRLPDRTRLRGLSMKRALKRSVADLVPRAVLQRSKRGFGLPLDRWFRTDLRGLVDGTLGAPNARVRAYLDPAALDALWAEHKSSAANHGHAIWTLLTLELFLRREGW